MSEPRLRPARIDFTAEVPRSLDFGDLYHSAQGAQGQARHVFLGGNGLPERWSGRRTFCILETGFGLGHNFLAAWRAWRDDPKRCETLHYWAVELHPPRRADLERAHAAARAADDPLVHALSDAWPALMPGLHLLSFDDDRVRLWLAFGEATTQLQRCVGRFDAFFLDGFAPDRNPDLWDDRVLRSLSRLAAPGATAATWSVAGTVRAALSRAGFEVERRAGFGKKKQMLVARYRPRHPGMSPPGRPPIAVEGPREAVVVGAGLAGAAVAHVLAQGGWRCTVLDKAALPATAASGNPAGLLHATMHRDDGLHARLHRAGALCSARQIAPWVATGRVPGSLQGLLAIHPRDALPLDEAVEDYARPLDVTQASRAAGLPIHHPAIEYANAGWVDPGALVRVWLDHPAIVFQGGVEVARVRRSESDSLARDAAPATPQARDSACPRSAQGDPVDLVDEEASPVPNLPPEATPTPSPLWLVEDAQGRVVARASVVVLAAGADLPPLAYDAGLEDVVWQVRPGQIDWCNAEPALRQPITGNGYAVTLPDGRLLYGATSREDDGLEPSVADAQWNRGRLQALTGHTPSPDAPMSGSRVSRRLGTPDRLPVVGPLPTLDRHREDTNRRDQVRFIPRQPGLFVCGGFGTRGLTWSALAAQVIRAWLDGTPMPLEADLLDAVDPARWQVRKHRRESAQEGPDASRGKGMRQGRQRTQAAVAPGTADGTPSESADAAGPPSAS
jgi:tRNA 5-methylaminomethyl-2-thiouridine biosynthesis bifunctional protein